MKKAPLILFLMLLLSLAFTACIGENTPSATTQPTTTTQSTNATQATTAHTHTIVIDAAVSPTCTKVGFTEGSHCSACGKILVPQTMLNKTEHIYNKDGKCSVCHKPLETTAGLGFELMPDGKSYMVYSTGNTKDAHIYIPQTYNGLPVTKIYDMAFLDNTKITYVRIPSTIVSIGERAFDGCSNLTSVEIAEGATSIGKYAFNECTKLESITIPASMEKIGRYAFYECRNLKKLYISDLASWCNIKFIEHNTGLSYIANPMFYGAELYVNGTLATELVIPKEVTKISAFAFAGCTSIESIVLHDGITYIGSEYDGGTFSGCINLKSVTIPNSITRIASCTFSGCTSLTSVTIPNSVTEIGSYAFSDCTGLESITIPNSVKTIFFCAFSGCTNLTSINFEGTAEEWNAVTKENYWNTNTGNYTVHCKDGDMSK